MYDMKFADIGEGITEGEIITWHVSEGDSVHEDQLLVEVHTEKVNVEITAPLAGVIKKIEKQDGDLIKVGETLVQLEPAEKTEISQEESPPPSSVEKDDSLFKPDKPFKTTSSRKQSSTSKKFTGRVLAAPAVRKKARELNIDISAVEGSGPAGRVRMEDIQSYLNAVQTSKTQDFEITKKVEKIPLTGTRRVIANSMHRSNTHVAAFTYMDELDATKLDNLKNAAREQVDEVKITYLSFIVKATVAALKKFPLLNSSLDEDTKEILVKHYYNIGIAVDTEEGLIVPVIKNVDQKSVVTIATEINELAKKARTNKLSLDEVSDSTFTITSIGNIGGLMATPVVKHPDAAILGVMQKKLKPVVVQEAGKAPEIAIKPMMNLSMSADHRIIDGAKVARFMNVLINYLENPELLLLEYL